jgi:hypothetical protein
LGLACSPNFAAQAPVSEPDPCQILLQGTTSTRIATGAFLGRPRPSPDGRSWAWAVAEGKGSRLVLVHEDGSLRTLTEGSANDRDPAFSPDGKRIVFSSDRAGSFDIWILELETGSMTQVTSLAGDETEPDWSPWPFEVVFESLPNPGLLRRVTEYHRIAFAAHQAGRCQIATVSTDGVSRTTVASTDHHCGSPRWAQDGHSLAYELNGAVHWGWVYQRRSDLDQSSLLEASWPEVAQHLKHPQSDSGRSWEGVARPSIARNGVWLFGSKGQGNASRVVSFRRDGREETELARGASVMAEPTWHGDVGLIVGSGHERTLCKAPLGIPLPTVTNLWSFPEFDRIDASHLLATEQFAVSDKPRRTIGHAANWVVDPWGACWEDASTEVNREADPSCEPPRAPEDRGFLITTDAVSELVQVAFAEALETIDREALAPRLRDVLETLHEASTAAKEVHRKEDRLLSILTGVGLSLLAADERGWSADVAPGVHSRARRDVQDVLHKLDPDGGRTALESLGIESIDPTELKPRGYYDKDGLRGYFRAMMWLARAHLHPAVGVRALDWLHHKRKLWEYGALLRTHRALLGHPEDGDLLWLNSLHLNDHGPNNFSSESVVGRACDQLAASPSRLLASTAGALRFSERSRLLYLVPPLVFPDTIALQALSFTGEYVVPRSPTGLDVAAFLGHPIARAEATDVKRVPFHARLDALRLDALRGDRSLELSPGHGQERQKNAYDAWLDVISLGAPIQAKPSWRAVPSFTKSRAYQTKQLSSALATYAALRRNTVLVTKPPRVRMGATRPEVKLTERLRKPSAPIYVEPPPDLYASLRNVLQRTRDAIPHQRVRALDDVSAKLEAIERHVLIPLELASELQLRGDPVPDVLRADLERIRDAVVSNWHPFIRNREREESCMVGELYDGEQGVRQIAIGEVLPAYAVVLIDGQAQLVSGGVHSYYEFDQPSAQRLTDAAWCDRVHSGDLPSRPWWTRAFIEGAARAGKRPTAPQDATKLPNSSVIRTSACAIGPP